MKTFDLTSFFRKVNPLRNFLIFSTYSCAMFALQMATPQFLRADDNAQSKQSAVTLKIRPANFDPADEMAYARQRGDLDEGMVANGGIWNKPPANSLAAVSGATATPALAAGSAAPVSAASGIPLLRMTYAEAYAQIPFSRTEYEANPSYRHDAAMELMFGMMRPTVTNRQTIPYFSRYPDLFRYRFPVFPYQSSSGGTSNFNMNWRTSLIAY